ncbi:hypothetical protein AVEN_95864-1 [Araneus ventricosus]|uniref:Uncharacterized protein n=1 Tax=Araneus ventricosus TaxID=182803 RepID=A0A4Y2RDJ9_ARAVE|nr:hypothetical protein AVEN_95864-1 [Araneus ventricosus]
MSALSSHSSVNSLPSSFTAEELSEAGLHKAFALQRRSQCHLHLPRLSTVDVFGPGMHGIIGRNPYQLLIDISEKILIFFRSDIFYMKSPKWCRVKDQWLHFPGISHTYPLKSLPKTNGK